MLRRLRISHFAIIDALEVSFDPGLTVLTGETGAGKSILVDALHLALGGRSQAEVVRTGCEEATVEAIFDAAPALRERLTSLGLPGGGTTDDSELLIRRVVHKAGRSRVWVNGALCTLGVLEQVARELCDISSQHEHISLLDPQGHLDLLDRQGRLMELRRAYDDAYQVYAAAAAERRQLVTDESERSQRADYLAYQLKEIGDLDPQPGEDAELAAERVILASAAKLQGLASVAEERLYSGERSAIEGLSAAAAAVSEMAGLDPSVVSIRDALLAARAEVEEASRELGQLARRLREDPARLEVIDDRLTALKRLARKHGGDLDAVLAKRVAMQQELDRLEGHAERLAELEAREAAALARTQEQARKLGAARREAAARLQTALLAQLAKLGMQRSRFEVRFEALPEPGPRGGEVGEFYFSANAGEGATAAGANRFRRRAVASDARVQEPRRGGRSGRRLHLRRGGQRNWWSDRADRRAHAQGGLPGPPGDLHHASAPDRGVRRSASGGPQGRSWGAGPSRRSSRARRRGAAHPRGGAHALRRRPHADRAEARPRAIRRSTAAPAPVPARSSASPYADCPANLRSNFTSPLSSMGTKSSFGREILNPSQLTGKAPTAWTVVGSSKVSSSTGDADLSGRRRAG